MALGAASVPPRAHWSANRAGTESVGGPNVTDLNRWLGSPDGSYYTELRAVQFRTAFSSGDTVEQVAAIAKRQSFSVHRRSRTVTRVRSRETAREGEGEIETACIQSRSRAATWEEEG